MKEIYAATILYFYPHYDSVIRQTNEIIEKRAMLSFGDYSSCETQCNKILYLISQKVKMAELKRLTDRALRHFTEKEKVLLNYRYFNKMPKNKRVKIDPYNRTYYKTQKKLLTRFAEDMEKMGITDRVFEDDYLPMKIFYQLKRREEKKAIAFCKKNRFKKPKSAKNKAKKETTADAQENFIIKRQAGMY